MQGCIADGTGRNGVPIRKYQGERRSHKTFRGNGFCSVKNRFIDYNLANISDKFLKSADFA